MIDGAVRIRISAAVSIGDCDPSEGFARHLAGRLSAFEPEFVPERVVFVSVAVGPPIHGDGRDVIHWIEASRAPVLWRTARGYCALWFQTLC